MMSDADRKKAADILLAAAKDRKQAVHLSKTWPGITIKDAYAISTEVTNRNCGRRQAHRAQSRPHVEGDAGRSTSRISDICSTT